MNFDMSKVSLVDDNLRLDPQEFYKDARHANGIGQDAVTGAYIVTRYEDIRSIMLDSATFSSETGVVFTRYKVSQRRDAIEAMYREKAGWLPMDALITIDAPMHKRYRSSVQGALMPARIEKLKQSIEAYSKSLIDAFIDNGEADYITQYSLPLPVKVISDQLGVEESSYDDFCRWSNGIVELVNPALDPDRELELYGQFLDMQQYFAQVIDRLRQAPKDCIMMDLVRRLDAKDNPLTMQEVMSIASILVIAGNETTGNAIGAGVSFLLHRPDIWHDLQNEPDDGPRMKRLVEEIVRLSTPAAIAFRTPVKDVVVAGTHIPKGALLYMTFLGGNLDETKFPNPALIDPNRTNAGDQLGFGIGVHHCVGIHLARLEMRVAIRDTIRRLRNVKLDPNKSIVRLTGFPVRGYSSLPILFENS